jgi:hypothetical protein
MSDDTMTIQITGIKKSHKIALEHILYQMKYLGGIGSSRWLAFYSDGDGDFHPKIIVDGEDVRPSKILSDADCWKNISIIEEGKKPHHVSDVCMVDPDTVAWKLHDEGD